MYLRNSESGHTVKWSPDNQSAAEQAMKDVVDRFDSWEGTRYMLDSETAANVRERYQELVNA